MGGSRCHTDLFLLENHPKIAIYVYQLNTMFRSSRPTMSIMFDYTLLMLVSHCGEYPCECNKIYSQQIRHIVANIWRMGLRMQFATNRNDRKMILVGVRKHSRSSCGVANIMLLSHCGEYLANVKHLYSRHIR